MSRFSKPFKIAVIGDIHNYWQEADNLALKHLGVDLVLFVGDFGNESVEIVRQIAGLSIPKAAIFGNHDAWYTASAWGRKQSPYDHRQEDRVQQQADLLGDCHVGYSKKDFPFLGLSVVGSRPFSWGGMKWKNRNFLQERYHVRDFEESRDKILAAVKQTQSETLIFLGHNGPQGLGGHAEAICGQDWEPIGGDHGDPDFAEAIAAAKAMGKQIPLVTFGHMHHRLRHRKDCLREMVKLDSNEVIYYNAACVPRIFEQEGQRLRNFSIISWEENCVVDISLLWLDDHYQTVSRRSLYSR